MRTYRRKVAGSPVRIYRVENVDDLDAFEVFVEDNAACLSVDTETTSNNIYDPGFRIRLAQVGTETESFILPIECGAEYRKAFDDTLAIADRLILHSAGFDLQAIDRHHGIAMESLWPKVTDTRILSHLVDPRGPEEGGIGQSLEALTGHWIDAEVAEVVKGTMTRLAKEFKTTKAKIWSVVDLDHPEYNVYSGMDPILTMRLYRILSRQVPASSVELIAFEHELAEVCSYYERTGFLLDVGYSENLSAELMEIEEHNCLMAAVHGVENVNSTDQVAARLLEMGVVIPNQTPTGKPKVDKFLLESLVNNDHGDATTLAVAVQEAKRAGKWRSTWVDGFLDHKDENDRCHPNINPLRARTARMSITGIPAQTLPATDMTIRRCFLSEPDDYITSVDYASQELRVLASLSGDETMIEAFRNDTSLHLVTAKAAFGGNPVKDSKEYKLAKTANFQKVYGGGPKGLANQTGIDIDTARKVHQGFDKAYPRVKPLADRLALHAQHHGYVVTPIGRHLPVDANRSYSALNYVVQCTGRDVTARGLIRAHRAGFTPYIRLPVHDEAVGSFPAMTAEADVEELAYYMSEVMGPVNISTECEVGKRSWGSLYGSEF